MVGAKEVLKGSSTCRIVVTSLGAGRKGVVDCRDKAGGGGAMKSPSKVGHNRSIGEKWMGGVVCWSKRGGWGRGGL